MKNRIIQLKEKAAYKKIVVEQNDKVVPEILKSIPLYFKKLFQLEEIDFELPKDFQEFIQLFGEDTVCVGDAYGVKIRSWQDMMAETQYWSRIDYNEKWSKKEAWLCVGEYGDKHWYFLCCDPKSPNFGKVADGHDNTPWNSYQVLDIDYESFTSFIDYILRNY